MQAKDVLSASELPSHREYPVSAYATLVVESGDEVGVRELYSSLRMAAGSTEAAERAGTRVAIAIVASRSETAAANALGSTAEAPYSRDRRRVRSDRPACTDDRANRRRHESLADDQSHDRRWRGSESQADAELAPPERDQIGNDPVQSAGRNARAKMPSAPTPLASSRRSWSVPSRRSRSVGAWRIGTR